MRIRKDIKKVRHKTRFSPIETRKHEHYIEGLLVLGASNSQIFHACKKPEAEGGLGVSYQRAWRLMKRIQDRWEEEDRQRSRSLRAAASRRLLAQIQNCQGKRDQDGNWIEKPNHAAIARYEELLATMQGTKAPIETVVTLNTSEAMQKTFARYTIEQLKEMHERAQLKKQLANKYLEEHPEVRKTIDVKVIE